MAPRRRFVKLTGATLAVGLAVYTGLSVFGAVAAMEIPRLPVTGSPAQVGLSYEDVSFHSRGDGNLLRGWFIPGPSRRVIILVHGGFQARVDETVDTLPLARDLQARGFSLLLFDLRGRGESTGRGRSLSNIERDVGGAIDYVKTRGYDARHLALLGFCSGAASACILGSEEELGALVLDGCFGSVRSMVMQQAAERHIPGALVSFFLPGVLQACHLIYDYQPVNPLGVVSEVGCPVLFIHEQDDELVPVQDNQQLYIAATNPESEMWDISGARHSEGYRAAPAVYVAKVGAFLQEHLAP